MKLITNNSKETINIGYKIGLLAKPNMIFCLSGDLGAGKTTLTKGIAKALNIKETITSPTFTIMKSYNGNMVLHHLDCYRLEGNKQDLGFEEYLEDDGLAVIEWSQYITSSIKEYLLINIEYINDDQRNITISAQGHSYSNLIKELDI